MDMSPRAACVEPYVGMRVPCMQYATRAHSICICICLLAKVLLCSPEKDDVHRLVRELFDAFRLARSWGSDEVALRRMASKYFEPLQRLLAARRKELQKQEMIKVAAYLKKELSGPSPDLDNPELLKPEDTQRTPNKNQQPSRYEPPQARARTWQH